MSLDVGLFLHVPNVVQRRPLREVTRLLSVCISDILDYLRFLSRPDLDISLDMRALTKSLPSGGLSESFWTL